LSAGRRGNAFDDEGHPVGVSLTYNDFAILFCIPKAGCKLDYLVERYTCFERIAVPSYNVVAGCVGRAVRAGAMPVPVGGKYRLTPEWFARIHGRDAEFAASELAMVECADEMQGREWPAVGPEFVLPEAEFEQAAEHTRRFLDELFGRSR
jgi:hypothetical protein